MVQRLRQHRDRTLVGLLLLIASCGRGTDPSGGSSSGDGPEDPSRHLPVFTDITSTLPQWRHDKAKSIDKHLPETMAGGGGFIDYDGDGDLDIYFVQSANYPGKRSDGTKGNVLLRREADGSYVDVTEEAGVGDVTYGLGCQSGDIDNDGDEDLYITNLGPNVLYLNEGGHFRSIGEEAGVAAESLATSSAFLDYDNDGLLDLYVCNYVLYNDETAIVCYAGDGKSRSYCSPTQFSGVDDLLFHNEGNHRFSDVSAAAGIVGPLGKGLGVCATDLDDDGLIDLVVANDTTPTLLFRNQGNGTFVEDGLMAGIARSEDGVARAGMGIDVGDVDGDGKIDIAVTNFGAEVNALYLGRDGGWFEEESHESGFGPPSYPFLGFGICLSDTDWDGDLDAFIINGHVLDTVDRTSKGTTYRQRPIYLRNVDGHFEEIGEQLGPIFSRGYSGRALATGDIDGDGDEDFLLLQVDDRPVLLRNDTPRLGGGIVIDLRGTKSNRDAIGAKVEVVAGGRTIRRSVVGGRSYIAMHSRALSIGVGAVDSIDLVRVTWPSGLVEELPNPPLNHRIVVMEGSGVVESAPLTPPSTADG